MLKGVPTILCPELLKTLDEMGHNDVLVLGDGNFPAGSQRNQFFQRQFFAIRHPLAVENGGIRAIVGEHQVFGVLV